MREEWVKYNVAPIEIPNIIDNIDRDIISPSESFGLAFTYVYQNYISLRYSIYIFHNKINCYFLLHFYCHSLLYIAKI